MSQADPFHVVVVGGGVAGLTAAISAAQAGASVACVEGAPLHGGLVTNVGRLDDWPAPQSTSGASLVEHLLQRARALDVTLLDEHVGSLVPVEPGVRALAGATTVTAHMAIVASGARLRRLDVPGEAELAGRGVSQCDWCDGGLYRGRRVAVVGGGNAALQAALHLADICDCVTVIARGATLRARRDYVLRAADHPGIEFLWETRVDRIDGDGGVQRVSVTTLPDNERSDLAVAAVFIFPGLVPNLDFAPTALARDDAGFALTDALYRSSVPGVLVVGAARSGNGGSLLAAMGEATSAASHATAQLRHQDLL